MLGFGTGRAVRPSAERFAAAPAEIRDLRNRDLLRDRDRFTARLKIVSLRIAITLQITKRERLEWILEASRRASELGLMPKNRDNSTAVRNCRLRSRR
jgi:hypothetical protein